MKLIALLLVAVYLGGCVPMLVGGVAAYAVNRDWCWRHYGNPHCYHHRMPMGVHR